MSRISYPIKVGYYRDSSDDLYEDKELFPLNPLNGNLEVTFNDSWLPDYVVEEGIVDTKTDKHYEVVKHFIRKGSTVLVMKYKSINPLGRYAIPSPPPLHTMEDINDYLSKRHQKQT